VIEARETAVRRSTVTTADGAFTFEDLPDGKYSLTAEKAGYVSLSFGAKRYNQAGALLVLSAGVGISDLRIDLPRSASVDGVVILPDGRPAGQATVSIARAVVNPDDGERHFVPLDLRRSSSAMTTTQTSSDGRFRLFGIPPGRYSIRARAPHDPLGGTSFGYTYYPGTLDRTEAAIVSLVAGQESAVTIHLQMPPRSRILGRVRTVDPTAQLEARISAGPFPNTAAIEADGTFRFSHVTPGRHIVEVRGHSAGTARPVRQWGRTDVLVEAGESPSVDVFLQPGVTVAGRVVFAGMMPSNAGATVEVLMHPLYPWQGSRPLSAVVDASGKFSVPDVPPGRYRVTAGSASPEASRWLLERILFDGRDVTDTPVSIESSRPGEFLTKVSSIRSSHLSAKP